MRRALLGLALGLLLTPAPAAAAQTPTFERAPPRERVDPPAPERRTPRPAPARSGPVYDGPEVRALAVFIRFRDDVAGSEPELPLTSTFRGWPYWLHDERGEPVRDARGEPVPADLETLPRVGHAFLAPSKEAIPAADSTLSAYFYHQSKAGRDGPPQFLLWGDVLPTNERGEPIVYVTKHDNAWYHNVRGTDNRRGYGYLTKEVLDHLVYERGVDLGRYNLNPEEDDVVDQIFLIVRHEQRPVWSGVSSLGHVARAELSGVPEGTARGLWYPSPSGQRDPTRPDSVRVDWAASGCYLWNQAAGNVHQQTFYARYGAHEYGHDLWRNAISSTHMGAVKNNVPANGEDGVHYYGGLLMGSSVLHNQRHIQTGHTISAYERSLFGWVALDTLAGTRTGVTLGDLYTYGEAAVLPIGHGDTERALFLSNHQRLSYFDSLKVGVGVRGDRYEREGLWLTGLLAHFRGRRDAKDCTAGTRPCVDILPADNVLDKDFVGDTYGPGSKTQLTPWTRPSINGCSGEQDDYCDDLDLTWAAIDAVRYLGDADSTIVFDFYEDFRAAPAVAIRADSWMGRRTHGAVFENEVRVTEGAALTVEAGTSLTFGGGVVVEEGARLTVEEGAVLRLGAGRRADVYGTLDARSAVFAGVSGERWDGLYFHPGARGTLTDLRLEDAETGGAPVVRDGAQVEVR